MAKIESEITVKVSNAEELQKLERNLARAEHLNEELAKALKTIQKTKLIITTEFGQISNSNSTEDEDDEDSVRSIESSIAVKVIDELENHNLDYESWLRISAEIEDCYHP